MMQTVVTPVQRRVDSSGLVARGLLEGIAIVRAKGVISLLPSSTEKAGIAENFLKSGTLSDKAQEAFACILAERGTYKQLVSVLDSKMVTYPEAVNLIKDTIRKISDSVAF